MQWVQAISIILIAAIGVWIAYQQMTAAHIKLKHDLFDRRYAVYIAFRNFIGGIVISGKPNDEDMRKFFSETSVADFLFNNDIPEYREEVSRRANELRRAEGRLDSESTPQNERERFATISEEGIHWFGKELRALSGKFKPYMLIRWSSR